MKNKIFQFPVILFTTEYTETLVFREERLRFWSDPDTELKLAKETGISVFRMGIDWTRIMPEEPVNGIKETVSLIMTILYTDLQMCAHAICPFYN